MLSFLSVQFKPYIYYHFYIFPFSEIFCAPYNDKWKAHKKFALMTLRNHGYGSKAGEANMISAAECICSEVAKNLGNPMELLPVLRKASGCVIFNILIGTDFNMEDTKFLDYFDNYMKLNELMHDKRGLLAFIIGNRASWIFLYSYMKMKDQTMEKYMKAVQAVVQEHIDTFDPENPRNVIDDYIKERGENIDLATMASNIMAYTGDAITTFSSCYRSVLFYVAKHQDLQKRVHDQLDQVCVIY